MTLNNDSFNQKQEISPWASEKSTHFVTDFRAAFAFLGPKC